MTKQGKKRVSVGRKKLPDGEKKVPVALYIRKELVESMGGTTAMAIKIAEHCPFLI